MAEEAVMYEWRPVKDFALSGMFWGESFENHQKTFHREVKGGDLWTR